MRKPKRKIFTYSVYDVMLYRDGKWRLVQTVEDKADAIALTGKLAMAEGTLNSVSFREVQIRVTCGACKRLMETLPHKR